MNITDRFIENLHAFSKRELNSEELLHAKKCLLDYLGVTLAGAKAYYDVERTLLETYIAAGGDYTVLGHHKRVAAATAALVNGISAHAVELDDGQRFGNIHPGAPVISALLPIGQDHNLTIRRLLCGIYLGYECTIRLACCVQPGHKLKGFHATGPCGTIGATMAIAGMLGYSKEKFKAALSVACTSASGILEMIEGDTQLMPYNAGKAASNAVVASAVGASNFKYPEDALGGNRGFLSCFADQPNINLLTDFNGKSYGMTNYFKMYAACGHCHSSIEAALLLRDKHLFKTEDIKRIDIQTYQLALCGHDHNVIDGVNSARMSIPYSTAVALMHGSADIEDFDEFSIHEKPLLELTSKITVRESEELTKLAPAKRIAVVTVCTTKGNFTETVTWPKGQPENPLSFQDVENKYRKYAVWAGVSLEKINKVSDMIMNADEENTVRDLIDCLNN